MHIVQRHSPVFLNVKRGVGGTASVAFPWRAVKLLIEDISFWPGFTFMVFGGDADIQKVVNLFMGHSQGGGDYEEKRQYNVRRLRRHVQKRSLMIEHVLRKNTQRINLPCIELLHFVNQLKFASFSKVKNNLSKEYAEETKNYRTYQSCSTSIGYTCHTCFLVPPMNVDFYCSH